MDEGKAWPVSPPEQRDADLPVEGKASEALLGRDTAHGHRQEEQHDFGGAGEPGSGRSDGAQSPPLRVIRDERSRTQLFTMAAAIVLVAIVCGAIAFRANVREYYLYLTERRPAVDFSFGEISGDWSEADLKDYFEGATLLCEENAGAESAAAAAAGTETEARACFLDIARYLNAPAMKIAFFFNRGKLETARVMVPVWAHAEIRAAMDGEYGRGRIFSGGKIAAEGLLRWPTSNGGAVFLNYAPVRNPFGWNQLLWMSPRLCRKYQCPS